MSIRIAALVAALLLLLGSLGLTLTACGVTEAGLTSRLLTAQDPAERIRTADRLAEMHSLAATDRLLAAAQTDSTAKAGLEALRDAYIQLLAGTLEESRASSKTLSAGTLAALTATVDCLGAIGDEKSLTALSDMVLDQERPLVVFDAGSSGTLDLELRGLDIIAGSPSAAALDGLVQIASLGGTNQSVAKVRDTAIAALQSRPEAVQSLLDARISAGSDRAVTDALDAALAAIGEPAVAPLVAALDEGDWVDAILVTIGSPAAEPLSAMLTSTDKTLRYRVLGLLAQISAAGGAAATAVLTDQSLVTLLIDARENSYIDPTVDAELENTLAAIGKPAISPLMAVIAKYDWVPSVLADMGADAVGPLKEALSSEDRDTRFAAADALVQMQETAPESVADLTQALEDSNLKYITSNYAYYIRLGKEGTEATLVKALNKYGDVTMAEDYLNCGNDTLEKGAEAWADKHGYSITTMPGSHGGPIWGEGD